MSHRSKVLLYAFGGLVGLFAICAGQVYSGSWCAMSEGVPGHLVGCGLPTTSLLPGAFGVFLVIGAAIVTLVVASMARQALFHHRLSASLLRLAQPAPLAGGSVGLVPGIGLMLVAGIRRPRTYCSADIVACLEPAELRAVLMHERHHELAYAPARLVVLAGLGTLLDRVGPGRRWLQWQRTRIEIEADAYALQAGVRRSSLAAALLKLPSNSRSRTIAAFPSASDLRLRALLGDPPATEDAWPAFVVRIGIAVVVLVALTCAIL